MRVLIAALAAVAMAGCATPSTQGGVAGDKNAEYTVTDRPDGFLLSVVYTRYQFIPESPAVAEACRRALVAQAYDEAEKRRRKIEPLNEQRVRLSMGRNGLLGITSCEASVPVTWAR